MMKRVNITTTNNFGNDEIVEFCGLVSSKIVVGANFFADVFASFTDVFGGRSGKYQSRLDEIYNDAINELSKQAERKGANGIVGLKMDFDEISGKDKSMFMVNAIGTAVIVDFKAKNETVFSNNNIISKDILENAIICHKIKKEILNGNNPSKDQYAVIVGNKDIAEPLIKLYLEKEKNTGLPVNTDETISFIKTLEQDFASDLMYNLLYSDAYKQETILSIINQCNLFDPQKTMKILSDGNVSLASVLLNSHKVSYTADDLKEMKSIRDYYNNLPENCTYDTISSGLFKKTEEQVWICKNGHNVPIDHKYCPNCNCNKKGVLRKSARRFEDFEDKVNILEKLLSK